VKYLKLAFGLIVVAGMMAVATSSAVAAGPVWVTCLPRPGAGHFEDSHCLNAKENGGWETSELTKTVEVTSSSAKLELEDSEALGGASSVVCSGLDVGTIGAGGSDSTTSITNIKCVKEKEGACKTLEEVKPANLPWSTQLKEENGEVRDFITSLIAGKNPGWLVKCNTALGVQTDECTGNQSTKIKANRTELSVEGTFEKTFKPGAKCSLGGKESGHVSGTVVSKLRMSNGELLSFWILAPALDT